MPATAQCPPVENLQQLVQGKLSDVEALALQQHLEDCSECADLVRVLGQVTKLSSSYQASVGKTPCPEPDTLQLLAGKKLAEAEAAPLYRHVDECALCAEIFRVLQEVTKLAAPVQVVDRSELPTQSPPEDGEAPAALQDAATFRERFRFLAPPEQPGELGRLGAYRILKVLGEGGMGMVFQAEDPALERLVALKVMKPDVDCGVDARQRFLQEAKAAASIQHDHIVTIYQVGEDRGVPFLAMQFLHGEPLDAYLKRVGRLPLEDVLWIGREVAEGLAAAHDRGLIHRDIKPGNIWLERLEGKDKPRVKILDFGLARVAGQQAQHLTRTGFIVGTPGYMAPEQARAGQKLDSRCDLFSLGCVLYRMCAGQDPFQGEDAMSILLAVALEQPRPLRELNSQVPPTLAVLVTDLLAKNPAERPASARRVAEKLATIERGRTQKVPPASMAAAMRERDAEAAQPLAPKAGGAARPKAELPAVRPQPPGAGNAGKPRPEAPAARPVPSAASGSGQPLTDAQTRATGNRAGGTGTASLAPFRPTADAPPRSLAVPPGGDPVGGIDTQSVRSLEDTSDIVCPRCGAKKFGASKVGWCISCGYYAEQDKPEEEVIAGPSPLLAPWVQVLLGGILVLALVSTAGHYFLPKPSAQRTWCILGEGILGAVLVVVAHVWGFIRSLPHRQDYELFHYIDPFRVWSYVFGELPEMRRPVWLACWGVTALLCALLVNGGLTIKFTRDKPRALTEVASNEETPEETTRESDTSDDVTQPTEEDMSESRAFDPDSDTDDPFGDKEPRRFTTRCVVIGYVPTPDRKIASIVIAAEKDGKYQYAGEVTRTLKSAEDEATYKRIQDPNLVTADPLIKDLKVGAIWIKPEIYCEVGYSEWEENGNLRNSVVKSWVKPKKDKP